LGLQVLIVVAVNAMTVTPLRVDSVTVNYTVKRAGCDRMLLDSNTLKK